MTARRLRLVQRVVHLVGAVVLVVVLVTPLIDDESWRALIRFVVLPVLGVSGLGIWLAPRVLAAFRRRQVGP